MHKRLRDANARFVFINNVNNQIGLILIIVDAAGENKLNFSYFFFNQTVFVSFELSARFQLLVSD